MTATTAACAQGASVCLLDEQQTPGGQIYRSLNHCDEQRGAILGEDYLYGKTLIDPLSTIDADQTFGATVWRIDENGHIYFSTHGQAHRIQARHIIIATGALERASPVPGWTLPGVMTVGAAQILIKSSGLITEGAVLAGTGPLLYTVAVQLISAGSPPTAIVDTQQPANYVTAAKYLPSALARAATLKKGLGYLAKIRSAGIPFYRAAGDLTIEGSTAAQALSFSHKGHTVRLQTDNVLLHQGVIPNTQLTRSLRLKHEWNRAQRCFHPQTSDWGISSQSNISIAGDGGGIGGAIAAQAEGHVAALGALQSLSLITTEQRDAGAQPHRQTLKKEAGLRRFLDALYPVPEEVMRPSDHTIICRCEDVTAGEIRSFVKAGCTGPNQTKAFGRCGMGPCQGRYCGTTVTEILAAENKLSHDAVGAYRVRAPIKPITLGELASLTGTGD